MDRDVRGSRVASRGRLAIERASTLYVSLGSSFSTRLVAFHTAERDGYARSVARAIGINHVALEVGDVEEALEWYGRFLDFELRGRRPTMAWIDLGDQFVALSAGRRQAPDDDRHFGLVVDDKEAVRATVAGMGVDVPASGGLRFRDPWGNAVEIVDYRDVQFTKAPAVLAALVPEGLGKSAAAREELARKGIAG